MGLFDCTRISPVARFDVCTSPDCWAHLERDENIGPLLLPPPAAAAPYAGVQKFTYSPTYQVVDIIF